MKCPTTIGRRRAAAIFLVLWAIFVISAALIVTARLVDRDLESESLATKRFLARQFALSGLAVASHPDVKPDSPLLRKTGEDGAGWEVLLTSENSKINLNRMIAKGQQEEMRMLFEYLGLDEEECSMLVDSLVDWVDEDQFRALNGAEAADIPLDSGWSRPENRPFLSVDEMERVRGMEFLEERVPGWRDLFSTLSSNRFDLQFASPLLLVVFGEIDERSAGRFVELRDGEDGIPGTEDDVLFESLGDALVALGISEGEQSSIAEWFRVGGGLRRIESRGFVGDISHTVFCVKDEAGSLFFWKER